VRIGVLATQILPAIALVIPTFILPRSLGLSTTWACWP
jgi:ABC-type glycerol-3-phosphate transport system permease component